jgi:hypothetical protein
MEYYIGIQKPFAPKKLLSVLSKIIKSIYFFVENLIFKIWEKKTKNQAIFLKIEHFLFFSNLSISFRPVFIQNLNFE